MKKILDTNQVAIYLISFNSVLMLIKSDDQKALGIEFKIKAFKIL